MTCLIFPEALRGRKLIGQFWKMQTGVVVVEVIWKINTRTRLDTIVNFELLSALCWMRKCWNKISVDQLQNSSWTTAGENTQIQTVRSFTARLWLQENFYMCVRITNWSQTINIWIKVLWFARIMCVWVRASLELCLKGRCQTLCCLDIWWSLLMFDTHSLSAVMNYKWSAPPIKEGK